MVGSRTRVVAVPNEVVDVELYRGTFEHRLAFCNLHIGKSMVSTIRTIIQNGASEPIGGYKVAAADC